MKGPVEAKVAASSVAALVVPAVFAAAAYYHWFTPPPAALQAAIIAVVTGVAGWLTPHTSRGAAAGMSDAERRRAENLRLTHAPGTPSFYPYPGEAQTPAETPAARPVDPAPIGRGGYTGGRPASEMPPPPTDIPSVSVPPQAPLSDGGGGGAP